MGRSYGGRFSPDRQKAKAAGEAARTPTVPARNPWRSARPSRAGARANFLFLVPLPLAVRAFGQDPVGLALSLAGLGLLLLAAWLTREGLLAEDAYHARKIARRPALPRKIFASVLTAAGLAVAVLGSGGGAAEGGVLALLGGILHLLAFGPDPLRDKGMEGIDRFQQDRVARAVDEAERHLAAMLQAVRRSGARDLEARVERFAATARDMFRTVEEDPRDLTAARRYLGVYLLGARDATAKFADIYSRSADPQARADYETLLDDLEKNFAARTRRLLLDDRSDLEIEIEVLRARLAREGLRERQMSEGEYDE